MKKSVLRILILVIVLSTVLASCSCSACSHGKTLLTLKHEGIKVTLSVNAYQLMLCRAKATLKEIGDVNSDAFWDSWIGSPAKTMDEYYRDNILENCKSYLVALYLFDYYELSLTEGKEAEIDEIMAEFVYTDGNGSKAQLNSVLSDYGVNYEILRDVYIMDAKIEALLLHLYGEDGGLITDNIKTEYMEENYVHYAHLFLPFSKYVYEKDKNGDEIYYQLKEDGTIDLTEIAYDKNGRLSLDLDKNNDPIYLNQDNDKIAYQKTGNVTRNILTDKDGNYRTESLTDAEKNALKDEKDALLSELADASYDKFTSVVDRENEERDIAKEEYTDGYYIRRSEYSGSYKYLNDIIQVCDELADGAVDVVKSDYGYHIIQKRPYTAKAYELEVNKTAWFEDFSDLVQEKLFRELCEPYYQYIEINEKVLATVPSMKEIVPSYFY